MESPIRFGLPCERRDVPIHTYVVDVYDKNRPHVFLSRFVDDAPSSLDLVFKHFGKQKIKVRHRGHVTSVILNSGRPVVVTRIEEEIPE